MLIWLSSLTGAPSLVLNLPALRAAVLAAMSFTGALGWSFERVIIRLVYGSHLKRILVTMRGLIVAGQLIQVIWSPRERHIARPEMLKGAVTVMGATLENTASSPLPPDLWLFWPCARFCAVRGSD